jgi:hypothetical protein
MRAWSRSNRWALGIDQITVGQLHVGEPLASELIAGGPCFEAIRKLRDEGKIGGWVAKVHPWTSHTALDHLRAGHGRDVIEGYTFTTTRCSASRSTSSSRRS